MFWDIVYWAAIVIGSGLGLAAAFVFLRGFVRQALGRG